LEATPPLIMVLVEHGECAVMASSITKLTNQQAFDKQTDLRQNREKLYGGRTRTLRKLPYQKTFRSRWNTAGRYSDIGYDQRAVWCVGSSLLCSLGLVQQSKSSASQ